MRRITYVFTLLPGILTTLAVAQNWDAVPLVLHSQFQAVNANGTSAYTGGFPIRLRGIVLNNNEDWLNPTADPNWATNTTLWNMGGQAEIFVQAIGDPACPWYLGPDFGGTKAWMGQLYGNHSKYGGDPDFHYSDTEWYSELDRLGLWRPGSPLTNPQLVRAGDLVELRARIGLNFQGCMNVNENHDKRPAYDFEIVILQKDFGLPQPVSVTIADFKDASNNYIFDPTRQTGGERFQGTLVRLQHVRLLNRANWAPGADLLLTDATGLTFPLKLGANPAFNSSAPWTRFNVVGIINQTGGGLTGGYRLVALSPEAFELLPPDCLGDANGDGVVDLADYNNVVNNLGATGLHLVGDTNSDGVIDIADYNNVVNNLGAVAPTGLAVPEPTSGLIILALAIALQTRRRSAA